MPLQGRPASHARGTLMYLNRAKTSVLKKDALISTLTNIQRKIISLSIFLSVCLPVYDFTQESVSHSCQLFHPPAIPHSWCVCICVRVHVSTIKAHLHTNSVMNIETDRKRKIQITQEKSIWALHSLKKKEWDWLLKSVLIGSENVLKTENKRKAWGHFLIIYAYSYTHWKYSRIGLSAACQLHWDDIWGIK